MPPTPQEMQAILPQYEIVKMLGRGGMGAVYMGRQTSLDRPVAIKILSGNLAENEGDFSFAERFKNEARAMAKLSHPGIIAVYDFGETSDGLLYIVMEYIDGTDVSCMIASKGRLHTEYAMAIAAHVCDALGYAHSKGIIHRDIKPGNIMVGYDGVVKVADFGLAKVQASEGQSLGLTLSGMAMGTMHFIAPEALEYGKIVDHRADLYAVGVMLYQMLTGRLPHGIFELPSMQVAGLDPRYDRIVARAMREDREERYQSAGELRGDLDAILTQPVVKVEAEDSLSMAALPTRARPQRPGGDASLPVERTSSARTEASPIPEKKPTSLLVAFGIAVLLAGAGAAFWLLREPDPAVEMVDTAVVIRPTVESVRPPEANPRTDPASPLSPSAATTTDPAKAAKEQPFANSLGMKFVPVPGTEVLFCIHETRYRDYAEYAKENIGLIDGTWRNQTLHGFTVTDRPEDHPVVRVSWEDAQKFCEWLGRKEGRSYRLPTDEEWSHAVGLGGKERRSPGDTPASLDKKVLDVYPWGTVWPPPAGSGNYRDQSKKAEAPANDRSFLEGYDDGYPTTAPVMSYAPNPFGLHDMGGNVLEWVGDWFDGRQESRVLRGAAFINTEEDVLRSSFRSSYHPPTARREYGGFRVVLVADGGKPASTVGTGKPVSQATIPSAPLDGDVDFVRKPAPTPVSPPLPSDIKQASIGIIKVQGPNAAEWALAALGEVIPADIRQNFARLREDLFDEGA